MKHISSWFFALWRPALIVLAVMAIAYGLFFQRIGNLTPAYAPREIQNYQLADSWQDIVNRPANAPYKIAVFGLQKIGITGPIDTRYVAAGFAVFFGLIFFTVAYAWFGYRMAFLSTLLFTTSSGFLHIARLGSPMILQMSLLVLLGLGVWLARTRRRRLPVVVAAAVAGLLVYVPSLVLFILLALGFVQKPVRRALKELPWYVPVLGSLLFLAIITPLVLAIVRMPSLGLTVLGLPGDFIGPFDVLKNIAQTILAVFVRGSGPADIWLAQVPLMNILELVLFALGLYALIRKGRTRRVSFIISAVLLSIILISLKGAVNISSLLPLIYLLVAGGITFLMQTWLTVFPRNPAARFTALAFLTLALSCSVFYHLQAYFIAWPKADATREIFTRRPE